MEETPCQPETVFSGPSCDIQYCSDCKMIHLNMGAITLRLSRRQYDSLAADLSKAATKLRQNELTHPDIDWSNVTTLNS